MSDIPQAAIDAAEAALRDWLEPWLTHEVYGTTLGSQLQQGARLALRDAEAVWPHAAAKRDPASSTHASLTIASSPYKPPAAARAEVFGFAPPGGWS